MKNISFRNDVLPLKNVLYRLALRITLSHEEAEDIVQDTLIKVWNKRDDWQEIDSIEAFSLTICRNLSLDRMKRAANDNSSIEESNVDAADTTSSPYEDMMKKDRIETVRRIVNGLPEKQRSCMQLRDFEGKSYKEISNILGLSEEQVKINIFRARQTVKQKYQEVDKYGL
ncbi:MAG: RNA polymerase sigma factor [Prevotellaceae bacterium]|nr:RNA polymerase sigma factor [Prevotellaceae bacterium]